MMPLPGGRRDQRVYGRGGGAKDSRGDGPTLHGRCGGMHELGVKLSLFRGHLMTLSLLSALEPGWAGRSVEGICASIPYFWRDG